MTEDTASPAAGWGRAADAGDTVEEMTTGGRLAVRGPRPTMGPAGGGTWGHRPGRWPARAVAPTGVGETPVPVAWTPPALSVRGVPPRDEARPLPLAAWPRGSAAAPLPA